MTHYPISNEENYPFTDEKSVAVAGTTEVVLSAADKWEVWQSWQCFVLSGFKKLFLTPPLYRFLTGWKFSSQGGTLGGFWHHYFNAEVVQLQAFLTELADPNPLALNTPAADLKTAILDDIARLYAPLSQVLQDLAIKHQEMIAAWYDFAAAANIAEATLPPNYQISENTRNLLAYAAQIALKHQRPLSGLQMMFPLQPQPLLPPPTDDQPVILLNGQGGG